MEFGEGRLISQDIIPYSLPYKTAVFFRGTDLYRLAALISYHHPEWWQNFKNNNKTDRDQQYEVTWGGGDRPRRSTMFL